MIQQNKKKTQKKHKHREYSVSCAPELSNYYYDYLREYELLNKTRSYKYKYPISEYRFQQR